MSKLSAWEIVKLARHPKRPTAAQCIQHVFHDFLELHGDRNYKDDFAILAGLAKIGKHHVTIIAQEKGVNTEAKIKHNFGMPHPEGYKKALRLMKQAEKFNRPIITIIDTPGAYPGIGAEQRGQAQAIANNLFEMSQIKVPIIAVVLSEGGSGGALAIGLGDRIFMYEHAIYAILSPEGFASILYKDSTKAVEAAEHMKLTAQDLKDFHIVDEIILEDEGLHVNPQIGFNNLQQLLIETLDGLKNMNPEILLNNRYQKYRQIGVFKKGSLDEESEI
jgi:acetyl-CoA carboxylase carboxyl transferase subunit alpha